MSQFTKKTAAFNRPPRVRRFWPPERIELTAPPRAYKPEPLNWMLMVLPLLSAFIMVGVFAASGQGLNPLIMGLSIVALAAVGAGGSFYGLRFQNRRNRAQAEEQQEFYLDQLKKTENRLQSAYDTETENRKFTFPDITELAAFVDREPPDPRLWERRPADDDFLTLRVGHGQLYSSLEIIVPALQPDTIPVYDRLNSIRETYSILDDVPVVLSLRELGPLGISGNRLAALSMIRAMLLHAAILHAPDELRVVAFHPDEYDMQDEWNWLSWLPHTIPFNNDESKQRRMVAYGARQINQLMAELLAEVSRRRDLLDQQENNQGALHFTEVLVVVDNLERAVDQPVIAEIMRRGREINMAIIFMVPDWQEIPGECQAIVDLRSDRQARWRRAGQDWQLHNFIPDSIDERAADDLVRSLARIELTETGASRDIPRNVRLFDLLNIRDERDLLNPALWNQTPNSSWHPDVPIGRKAGNDVVFLDLDEQRHGSHGIIAGATGAGKSVLMQGVIASLALTHAPERVQFLLIDFKGGASLSMFAPLPHTVGLVTDLEGRLAERAIVAINSEIRRRKQELKKVGAQNIKEYRQHAQSNSVPPLANLLIVIDEFDEMVTVYREFVADLVRVVKQGRSLGVHLLLATQQPSKAVKDDIRTQLKFFIALRLGSSEDSREMLLKPDAAFLPTDVPGRAYFRVGAETELFQVAQVAQEFHPATERKDDDDLEIVFGGQQVRNDQIPLKSSAGKALTDLDVLVQGLQRAGTEHLARLKQQIGWEPQSIWQPPLPRRIYLGEIDSVPLEQLAGAWQSKSDKHWLQAMIGVIDIPQESRRDHLQLDLNSGHLAIIGAPGSGKTMLLRTLLLSLALRHSPQDLWCYLIDAGGQGLSLFTGLPHVGGLIQVGDRERIRRLFWMIDNELRERQERFRSVGASDLQIYRANSGERLPAIVVMLDKFALLREELQDDIDQLVRFARTGRAYGVHFVITADRTSDIGYKLLSLLEHRVSLRMPDLYDYSEVLGGRVSSQIPADIPGRGFRTYFDQGILEIQLALPSLERSSTNSETDPEDGGESAAALDAEINSDLREHVAKLNDIWQQSFSDSNSPQAVELLRDYVALEAFLNGSGKSLGPDDDLELPLGIEDLRLCQSKVRLGVDAPHMLVLGGRRSGKTTTMLTMLIGLADQYSAEDLRFLIVDIRGRGLRPLRDLPHTERYAVHEDEVQELATYLRRIERQDVEPCRRVVVVDDFDLGAGTLMKSQFIQDYGNNDNLFGALTTLAATGGDIGMHLILAGNIDFISGSPGPLKTLNDAGNGLVLRPNTYVSGTELLGLRLPIGQRDTEMPSGRAVLVVEGDQQVIQIASLPDADLPAQIARLVERATAGVLEP